MKSVLIRAATLAALCAAAPLAHAGPVLSLVQTGFANAGADATLATAGGPSAGTFRAGEFTGTVDGTSFLSYCIDLAQHFGFGTAYGNYVSSTGSALLGATRATQIGELLTAAGGFALSTPSRSAALQGGIWEILYENSGSFGLGGGSFTITPGTVLAADLSAINGYLSHLGDYAPMSFTAYASPTQQDFIAASRGGPDNRIAVQVPEPSGLALVALALAGAGIAHRTRRRAAGR